MAGEIKLRGPSMEQRIADRLKNSGNPNAEIVVKHGDGPTRTFTNISHSGNKTRSGAKREDDGGR